jgi:hypothetical protein
MDVRAGDILKLKTELYPKYLPERRKFKVICVGSAAIFGEYLDGSRRITYNLPLFLAKTDYIKEEK